VQKNLLLEDLCSWRHLCTLLVSIIPPVNTVKTQQTACRSCCNIALLTYEQHTFADTTTLSQEGFAVKTQHLCCSHPDRNTETSSTFGSGETWGRLLSLLKLHSYAFTSGRQLSPLQDTFVRCRLAHSIGSPALATGIDNCPFMFKHGQLCPGHMYMVHTTGCTVQSWHSLLSQASCPRWVSLCDCCVRALAISSVECVVACASREGLGQLLRTTNSACQAC
jgi:hypothetical protein